MSYETVIVGYDGSKDADRAVVAAADQVASDGTVHVVTAYRPESDAQLAKHMQELPEEFRYTYDPAAAELERQRPVLDRLHKRGIDAEGHVVPDDPASAIIDVAERTSADLVVVGSRGLSRVEQFLRGSVSIRIAHHAPASVLIVHGPPDED